MAFNIIGKLIDVKEQRNATQTFVVREFVIEVEGRDPRYNDTLLFQLTGNNISMIDAFKIGDYIDVTFDLRGRTAQSKDGSGRLMYFTTLNAWRLSAPQAPGQAGYPQQPQQGYMPQQGYAPQQPQQGFAPQQPQQPAYTQAPPQMPQGDPMGGGNGAGDLPF